MPIQPLVEKAILVVSAALYVLFWLWALIHASRTPKSTPLQRALWVIAMVANPTTAIWYWYIWKRWAFFALFTPVLGIFLALPVVVHSILDRGNQTVITNTLFAIGSANFVLLISVLMIFPLLLRLAALLHIGRNSDLSAMDRNDWVVSLALPVFGFGAGIAYCARYRRVWAIVGLMWGVVIAISVKTVTMNISQALVK